MTGILRITRQNMVKQYPYGFHPGILIHSTHPYGRYEVLNEFRTDCLSMFCLVIPCCYIHSNAAIVHQHITKTRYPFSSVTLCISGKINHRWRSCGVKRSVKIESFGHVSTLKVLNMSLCQPKHTEIIFYQNGQLLLGSNNISLKRITSSRQERSYRLAVGIIIINK